MKFIASFKHPDGIYYALESIPEEHKEDARDLMHEWMAYGEYIDIEFDTKDRSARLIKPKGK